MVEQLAILGPRGTFSDVAAQAYLEQSGKELAPVFYGSIDEAFHSVGGECEYGVIPIENTLDGYVQRTLDLLLEMDVHVLGEVSVPVQFSLVANAADREEIRRLFVQFKAAGQCRRVIDSLQGVQIVSTESNMLSHQAVEQGEPGDAAIIPRHMLRPGGELSPGGKRLSMENVTDARDNHTRFIIVKSGEMGPLELEKDRRLRACVYVMPEVDRPGILFEILREFYEQEVNLASIMSRPTKTAMGSYNFYIEVDGGAEERDKILRVLIALKAKHAVKLLGVYSARKAKE